MKALKETALESARLQVAATQKEADELTCAAAEKQCEADTKTLCYFEAHAQSLEVVIASETQGNDYPAFPDEYSGELRRLEYEYRAEGAVAS